MKNLEQSAELEVDSREQPGLLGPRESLWPSTLGRASVAWGRRHAPQSTPRARLRPPLRGVALVAVGSDPGPASARGCALLSLVPSGLGEVSGAGRWVQEAPERGFARRFLLRQARPCPVLGVRSSVWPFRVCGPLGGGAAAPTRAIPVCASRLPAPECAAGGSRRTDVVHRSWRSGHLAFLKPPCVSRQTGGPPNVFRHHRGSRSPREPLQPL